MKKRLGIPRSRFEAMKALRDSAQCPKHAVREHLIREGLAVVQVDGNESRLVLTNLGLREVEFHEAHPGRVL